jgi:hypothetical protein
MLALDNPNPNPWEGWMHCQQLIHGNLAFAQKFKLAYLPTMLALDCGVDEVKSTKRFITKLTTDSHFSSATDAFCDKYRYIHWCWAGVPELKPGGVNVDIMVKQRHTKIFCCSL